MSERQTTKTMTPIQIFEKAVIKAMLKNRGFFVTREEVRKYLPRGFDDDDPRFVDVNDYLFCPCKWDSNLDVISLPKILHLFPKADLERLKFLVSYDKLQMDLDELNKLVVDYYQYMMHRNTNDFGELLLNKASTHFLVEMNVDEQNLHYNKYNVYDGEELVTSITFNRVTKEYDFYDDEDEDEGEGE